MRPILSKSPGIRIMEMVNGALIQAKGECILNLEDFERIAGVIDAEIAKASKFTHLLEPPLAPILATPSPEEAQEVVNYTPEALEALRLVVGGFAQFRRRPTTKWSERELKALKAIFPYSVEDLAMVSKWYDDSNPTNRTYCRRDVQTFLNNFQGEVDRARQKYATAPTQPKKYNAI